MQGNWSATSGKTLVKTNSAKKSTSPEGLSRLAKVSGLDTGKFKLINPMPPERQQAINPLGCRAAVNAAITIGQAMFEEIAYDNGQ
jgi:hypothetical protein